MKTNAEWLDELLTRQERKRFIRSTGIKDPEEFVSICKSAVLDITRDTFERWAVEQKERAKAFREGRVTKEDINNVFDVKRNNLARRIYELEGENIERSGE